ncbi:MAG: F0F1 ATP synthase subunit delta [Acidobacteria bacterium]|nr:F0F1 ATP synthase subunit delta [Acidobacteriota bacterium]
MSVETIARRYATALADVVVEKNETDVVRGELKAWEELIRSNIELNRAFGDPSITHVKKEGVLEALLQKTSPTQTTANFLRVLLRNSRITDLADINERFVSVLEERSGLVNGTVTSAHPLTDTQKNELQGNLEKVTGKTVNLTYSIDPELIGGVVTRIGSTVYDGSVRTQLEHLREQLLEK